MIDGDDMLSALQHGSGIQVTGRVVLAILSVIAIMASGMYWWGIQSALTGVWWTALVWTLLITIGPPATMAFVVRTTPGGMLWLKVHMRTWGMATMVAVWVFLMYYSFDIQYTWWLQQPAHQVGLAPMQAVVGIIGFIVIPSLLVAPVSNDELIEAIRQAHLVRRYEMMVQSDVDMLRTSLMRWTMYANKGMSNLSPRERADLAAGIRWIVTGMDETLRDLAQGIRVVTRNASFDVPSLRVRPSIRDHIEHIEQTLLTAPNRTPPEPSTPDRAASLQPSPPPPSDRRVGRRPRRWASRGKRSR